MMRLGSILFIGLLFAACDDRQAERTAGNDIAPAAAEPEPTQPSNEASAEKPLTSVMRPSVVAEVEPEAPPPPPQPARAVISFENGGATLDERAHAAIEALLATPAAAGETRIVIRGHSDSKGSDRQNMLASKKRAEAVRDYLIERGIAENRITVIALGENRPAAPNATPDGADFEEGRRKNRRAEIEILPEAPAATAPAESENPDQPPGA